MTCKPLEVITCGQISPCGKISYNTPALANGGYNVYTVADFMCKNGHTITGPQTSICKANGAWNQATPQCIPNGNKMSILFRIWPIQKICLVKSAKNLSYNIMS